MFFLQKKTFGKNQWAFSPGLSFKNLMTMLMMSFILAVCTNQKTCAFLSDSSGAFDRVSKEILLSKLQGFGVGETCLRFLDSYLAPRVGNVVVQGKMSENMIMDNSVWQGTVFGPPLWNSFFSDVSASAQSTGGQESMFADDLNVFKKFGRLQPLPELMSSMEKCRSNVPFERA